MPGADDTERLQNALDVAARTHEPVRTGELALTRPVRLSAPAGERYAEGVEIVGTGVFSSIRLSGDSVIEVAEGKRVVFRRCGFLREGPRAGTALRFAAKESSSSLKVVECAFQGFAEGLVFEGLGGADVSVTHVQDSTFTDCGSGIVYRGSNNLDPRISNANFSSCDFGIDAREGGSNIRAWACGASYCGTVAVVNGGYQGSLDFTSVEGCQTVFRLGGDDAGGFGQTTSFKASVSDARDCKTLLEYNGAGRMTLEAMKCSGAVKCENRHQSATAALTLSPEAYKLPRVVVGKVSVKVQ